MKSNEKVFFIGASVITDLLFHEGKTTLAILEIMTDKMKDDDKE